MFDSPFRVTNVQLVGEHDIHFATSLRVNSDGCISDVDRDGDSQTQDWDGGGGLLIPGAIDLHCDALEKIIETRPGVLMPAQHIMPQADHLYAAAGITTIFHAVSFAGDEASKPVRQPLNAADTAERIHAWQPLASIDHRLHTRYEVGDPEGLPIIKQLIDRGMVALVSVMDHSPGQGQFPDFEKFFQYFGKTNNITREQAQAMAQRKQAAREDGWQRAVDLILYAAQADLVIASHDDDSEDRVRFIQELGGHISEFPVNIATAHSAREAGLATIMGSPNIIRGQSQSGNMKALDAVQAGVLDCLCADYVPWTLVAAALMLPQVSQLSLCEAVHLIANNPASAAGLSDRGSLAPGKRADMVLIQQVGGVPVVTATWSGGRCVYRRELPGATGFSRAELLNRQAAASYS